MKKLLINLLKFGVSFVIIAYLVYDAQRDDTFAVLRDQPKHWGFFGVAFVLCFLAVCLTFVRWYFLVRALELPFRWSDAFRLGFLGYLFNFVSLGSVGGDLFKAVFIAREQPTKRAEAVATVVIDRVIGLYVLFVVGTVAILATGLISSPVDEVRFLSRFTVACTVIGGLSIIALILPGSTNGRLSNYLRGLPKVGHVIGRLLEAIRMYRVRPGVLTVLTCLLSVIVHCLNTFGVYLIARGLPGDVPSLASHFVIVSLGMVAGAAPLPLSGLGAFEGALDFLYRVIPVDVEVPPSEGLIVAFGFRIVTIVIALVGVCYYLRSRRDVSAALHEAEHLDDAESSTTALPVNGTAQARSSDAVATSERSRG